MKPFFLAISFLIVLISSNEGKATKQLQTSIHKIDSITIRKLFNTSLANGKSYQWLEI